MNATQLTSVVLVLVFSIAVLVAVLTSSAHAAVGPSTVLDNGVVQLGVNPGGNLVAPGGTPSSATMVDIGLRFEPSGNEGVSLGSAQESWGVADKDSGTTGSVNKARGDRNVTVASFSSTGTTASSVVDVAGSATAPSFRITHEFRPSVSPNLFEATVTVENTSTARAGDVRYRRVVDWDVEPTPSDEFATVGGEKVPALLFSSNEGFADQDPLVAPENWGASGFFTDSGPDDLGALVDLGLGALDPGQKRSFTLYYGAAADEAEALSALREVAAEFYALGQPNVDGKDGGGAPTTFVLAFDTKPPNASPAAKADAYETNEDEVLNVPAPGLLGNDVDAENAPLTARIERGPEHGTLDLKADGSFSFAPNKDFNGRDSFSYRASDGAKTSRATTVETVVKAVNDAPTVSDVPDQVTDEDTPTAPVPFAVSDVETAPGELKVTAASDNPELVSAGGIVVEGSGADRTVRVAPAKNRHGTTTITLTASENTEPNAAKTSDSFVLTVKPVNDAPSALPDAHATDEDATLAVAAPGVLGNDSDADGDPLLTEVGNPPANGALSSTPDGSFEYTPRADFNGEDYFTYKACDDTEPRACSAAVTTTINVRSVNDSPNASDDSASTISGRPVTVDVLTNDKDVENDKLTLGGHEQGTDGEVTCAPDGRCTYKPKPGFVGHDAFSYTVADGNGGTNTATVRVNVAVPPPPPETTITSGPSGAVKPGLLSLAFTSDLADARFECSMDAGSFAPCASPIEYRNLTDGEHRFEVRALDRFDQPDKTPAARAFRVDGTAPVVSSRAPDSGASGVPFDANVVVEFSEDVDPATVTNATMKLVSDSGDSFSDLRPTITYDPTTRKATIDPYYDLDRTGRSYTVTVKGGINGVKDQAGNALAADETWRFKSADTSAPTSPTIDLDERDDTGTSNTDNVTKFAQFSLVGDAEVGGKVKIYDGTDQIGTATAERTDTTGSSSSQSLPGRWTFTTSLPLSDGTHHLSATATDAAGNASPASTTLDVFVDTKGPVTGAPTRSLVPLSTLGDATVPVDVAWPAATDAGGSGVVRHELQQSAGAGPYSDVPLPSATAASVRLSLAPGASGTAYRFQARGEDRAGNAGEWAQGTSFTLSAPQENGAGVTYPAGTWTSVSGASFYGGAVKYVTVSAAGPRARYTFTGSEVAWVSTKNGSRGRAEVWVDGVKQTTVDLYSATAQVRHVVYRKAGLDPAVTHTMEVRPTGASNASSSSTRVDIDAFVSIR